MVTFKMFSSNARCQLFLRQLILVLLASITKQQDNFYFDPAPINQDVLEGEPVKLRCDVSNRKMIYFYWMLNGRQLTNTSRRFQEDSDLRILWVDRHHDNGSLRCIATNVSTGIALRSAEAKLNILWISKVAEVHLKHPKEYTDITELGEVNLRCAIEGNPDPTFDWYKNKIRLVARDRVKILRGRLRLMNVTAEDNGVYSCSGLNVAGQVDSTDNFLLNVAGVGLAQLKDESFIKFLLVRRTDSAMFHCQYNSPVVSTEWHFEQKRLASSAKYTVFGNGSLLIQNVDHSDVGYYRCVGVVGETGSSQTFAAELRLAYLDEMTDALMDPVPSAPVIIPVNGRVDIRCHRPNGLPTPTLRWINPYHVQVEETDHRIKAVDGILSLINVEETDSGSYTCQTSNMAATRSLSISIIVSVAPKISRPPLSIRVLEGATATFDCKVIATPFPVTVITWTLEDGPLKNASGRFLVDERLGILTVTSVHQLDEGNYACVVKSRGHQAVISSNAHLYVEKQLKFKPVPKNTKLDYRSPGKLACHAEGRSTPSVRWLKNGRGDLPSHVLDMEGILDFQAVQYSDAGNYTCIATNEQGTINATFMVDIVVKPHLQVKPVNITVREGLTAMFHCIAIGDPSPTVHWDHNNKIIDFSSDRIKVLSNGSLQVAPAYIEDSGMYGCTAGNSAGFTREEVFLRVLTESNFIHYQNAGDENQSDDGNFSVTRAIVIAVCCVAAYLTIVIGLTVYCSLRLVRARNLRAAANVAATPTEQTGLMSTRDSSVVKCDTDNRSHISGISSQPSQSSHSNPLRPLPGFKLIHERLQFSRNQLQTVGMLGKCNYGDVFVAKAFNIVPGNKTETLVVVKSLLSQEEHHLIEAKTDIENYSKANHLHVARLLGICRELEPVLAIYEYTDWGNLKQFLQLSQINTDNVPQLHYLQKLTTCIQVAQGMEYLSSLQLVHKDLAARNVLIFPNFDVKIANLGLCRDVFANDYFLFHQHLIPLRWMPPEAVFEDKYSVKSDVWSYGVFVWEVFSQASLPLINKSNDEVLKGLKTEENKLSCPSTCPENVWTIVERCIQCNTNDRPNFTELVNLLNDVLAESMV